MTNAPQLQTVLQDQVPEHSPFSKINFLQFLVSKHCIENYECHTEITIIMSNLDSKPINRWGNLYTEYIENDSLNLPESISNSLSKFSLPDINTLHQIHDLLMNYLFTSYCEFISQVKRSLSSINLNSTSVSTSSFVQLTDSKSTPPQSATLLECESWGNKISRKITRWRRTSNTSSNSS